MTRATGHEYSHKKSSGEINTASSRCPLPEVAYPAPDYGSSVAGREQLLSPPSQLVPSEIDGGDDVEEEGRGATGQRRRRVRRRVEEEDR